MNNLKESPASCGTIKADSPSRSRPRLSREAGRAAGSSSVVPLSQDRAEKRRMILLLFGILLIPLFLSGCVIGVKKTSTAPAVNDGGVYVTNDKGLTWTHNSVIYRINEPARTFNNIDLVSLVPDPTDNKAYYAITLDQGMFYTYDGATGWQQTLTGKGKINAVAISPKNSCIIYAAISNKVYKSTDCNRHWEYKLIEARSDPNNQITSLAVDYDNPSIVFAGTSGKGLFRSDDAGLSWRNIKYFDDRVNNIIFLPKNSNVMYVTTPAKGIYKSVNKGQDWTEIFSDDLVKKYKTIKSYYELILDPTADDGLMYACKYGLFRSTDGGATWSNVKLLTPANSKVIYAIAVNPKDSKEIYYTVDKVLYHSIDGGVNWNTKTLPSSRLSEFLFIDPQQPSRLYLGIKTPPKQ